jgi:DNA-(apurinic or apyrimidinic site) lyase
MNQTKDAKTIVFAVKIFSYWARNYFDKFIEFPFEIEIPIDSRLEGIYEIYNSDKNMKIKEFYKILSKKLNIPPLHLDAIIWCNYEELKNSD